MESPVASSATFSFTAQQAQSASQQYELMLHGLTHEHNASYFDRHALLLEKWCRDYSEGLYIRDLRYVIRAFAVLRERLASHPRLFRGVLSSVLKICALPLFEAKANERLRSANVELIKEYFYEICKFWIDGDALRNSEIARCFRCIVNGGLDPTVLKVDIQKWTSDGLRVQVTDRVYLQTLLRDGGVVDLMADYYKSSAELYCEEFHMLWESMPKSKDPNKAEKSSSMYPEALDSPGAAGDDSDNEGKDGVTGEEVSMVDSSYAGSIAMGDLESSKEALADSQELTKLMTSLMMELCEDAQSAISLCTKVVADGAIKLMNAASKQNLRDAAVSKNIDLIWTVLDAYLQQAQGPSHVDQSFLDELRSFGVMNYEIAVTVLLRVFLDLMHDGYRLADKECRNEIAVVLSMVASFPASFPAFMSTRALNAIVTYTCVAEMGHRAWPFYTLPIAKFRNFASTIDIDLQLKRTLWMTITDLLRGSDPDALLCLASSPVIDMMLDYVEFDSNDAVRHTHLEEESATLPSRMRLGGSSVFMSSQTNELASTNFGDSPGVRGDGGFNSVSQSASFDGPPINPVAEPSAPSSPSAVFLKSLSMLQLRELQVLAMSFLAEVSPRIIGEFLRISGPVRVLDVLFRYSRSTAVEHKRLVYTSVLALNRCLMCSDVVKRLMEMENGAQTFLYLFEHTDEDATKALVARLVSILCQDRNEICQQQTKVGGGIALLVRVIASYAEHRRVQVGRKASVRVQGIDSDAVEDPDADSNGGDISLLIIAVLDCLGKVTVKNRRNEAQLAKDEGIDALLLLLEVSPFLLRMQVLRLMADLLENRQLLPFLHAWRSSKSMRSATQVFAHCWLDEEARLNVNREKGMICNIWDPLGNHCWPVTTDVQHDSDSVSSGSVMSSAKSLAVSRLADAISSTRAHHGAVPEPIRRTVLDSDSRGITARILHLIGSLDGYVNAMSPDFRVSGYFQNGLDDPNAQDGDMTHVNPPPVPAIGAEEMKNDHFGSSSPQSHATTQRVASMGDPGLTPTDKQVISIAQQYHALRAGEWWRTVITDLREEGIKPIESDMALVESRMSSSYDAAFNVQMEQFELHHQETGLKSSTERTFIGQILQKKDAQIKAEYMRLHGSRRVPH